MSYFDEDLAAHVSMADPVCPALAEALFHAASTTATRVHRGGTYVCIEGPRFSTRAESHLFRSWGATVVGMTNVPECFLARELELPYATLALATDYDCWHEEEAAVDVAAVVAVVRDNVERAREAIRALAKSLPDPSKSIAANVLRDAVMTDLTTLSPAARAKLQPVFARYWK